MPHCAYHIPSATFSDDSAICDAPLSGAGHVCNECGDEFCSQHITNCQFCGALICTHCACHHAKACSYNEAEAS